ncbi:hypothetical protein ACPXCG_06075 [Gordonia sp. DT218]|uniref:hypothetical protein n=1 Tax=Gordonia sp. DT218 TaxID=3416659 RepID=UPI003CF036B5
MGKLTAFETWNSSAGDAARESVSKTRKDLDRHGEVATRVADAARRAEGEIDQVKESLKRLRADVAKYGFVLDANSDTIFDPHPPNMDDWPAEKVKAYHDALERLQFELLAVLTAAVVADHDLAKAIDAADGDVKGDVDWAPSTGDVVLGSTAGLTGAKADIIRDIWLKSIGENPTGVNAKILPWLEDIGRMKGISKIGGVVGVLTAVPSVFADHDEGNSWSEAITRETASTAVGVGTGTVAAAGASAAMASIIAGTEVGATIGSVVPGAGTIVGAIAGAAIGGTAAFFTSKGIDALWD